MCILPPHPQKLGVHVKMAAAAAAGLPSPHTFGDEIQAMSATLELFGRANLAVTSGLQGASAPSTPASVRPSAMCTLDRPSLEQCCQSLLRH